MIEYKTSSLDIAALLQHFEYCDSFYVPRLSERINLVDYAQKITVNACTFEAWEGEGLLGVVSAYLNRTPYGFITDVSVKPESKGKGIAKNLVRNCIDAAQNEYGLCGLKLEVYLENRQALNLYKTLGFIVHSKRDQVLEMILNFRGESK